MIHSTRSRPGRALALPFAAALFTSLHGSACLGTAECDALRERLLATRATWDACDPARGDDDCILVGGQDSDCTGVLRCPIPVQRDHRADAERAVIDVASESPKCAAVCSRPTCGTSDKAYCDATARRCIVRFEPPPVVTGEVPDAGAMGEPADAVPPPDSTSDASAPDGSVGF